MKRYKLEDYLSPKQMSCLRRVDLGIARQGDFRLSTWQSLIKRGLLAPDGYLSYAYLTPSITDKGRRLLQEIDSLPIKDRPWGKSAA